MSKLQIIEVTKEELDNGSLPFNHIIVESEITNEGRKTKGGIIVGMLEDTTFGSGENSLAGDMVVNHGTVYKLPDKLYYNEDDPQNSLPWDCDIELMLGDEVWFSIIEAYNATTLLCEGRYFRIIPWSDLYVAKRKVPKKSPKVDLGNGWYSREFEGEYKEVIPLNGYVLCQTVNRKKLSDLDTISEEEVDMTRAKVCFTGKPNKSYLEPSYVDFVDLMPGDEVLLQPRVSFLYLERKSYFASFMGDELFIVVPRRKIVARINKR